MDGYSEGISAGSAAQNKAVRPPKPSEQVRDNAERLVNRLNGIYRQVEEIRDRAIGAPPSAPGASDIARDTLSVAGFIPGVGTAVERSHTEVTMIEDILSSLAAAI